MASNTYGAIKLSTAEDVGAVLKKKTGSADGYKPKEWADTINLLGLLPIRTASGTIAHFEDGADDVPCVSVVANIVPIQEGTGDPSQSNKRPIHGHTECEVTQQGANLLDISEGEIGKWIDGSGNETLAGQGYVSEFIKTTGTALKTNIFGQGDVSFFSCSICEYDKDKQFIRRDHHTTSDLSSEISDTLSNTTAFVKFQIYLNGGMTQTALDNGDIMVSFDSTTTYEAYKSETYTTEMPVMKNLFTGLWEDKTVNESLPSGTTYANMKSASTTRKTTAELLRLPSAPFVFSCSSGYDLFLTFYDEGGLYIGQYKSWADSKVITSTDAKYVGVTFRKSNNQTLTADDEEAVHVQLEEGSTATSYEPYRTVFVGTLDLVSGLLTITHRFQALDALGWNKNGSTITFYSETLTGLQGETDDFYCSCYLPTENGGYNGQNGKTSIKSSGGTSQIWVADNSYPTSADFKASLTGQTAVLKLSTPVEVQLTPEEVRTFLGANNFFDDCGGDTKVEYRADIGLLLASLQGNRGLQMMRATPTEETEEQEATENEDNEGKRQY